MCLWCQEAGGEEALDLRAITRADENCVALTLVPEAIASRFIRHILTSRTSNEILIHFLQ
jgi:hypothetical protein